MNNILIVCGRIESAVGQIAYSTSELLVNSGKNCYFLGLNSTLNYTRSYFDYSVNSKTYQLKLLSEKSKDPSCIKRILYKFLHKMLSIVYGDCIYGVKNNKKRFRNRFNKVLKKLSINKIVSFYMPIDILELCYDVCSSRNIEFVPFLLDSVKKDNEKEYDLYFSLTSHILSLPWVLKDAWFLNKYDSKIISLNLPILPWQNKSDKNHIASKEISFVLFGALYDDIRNPSVLFDSFLKQKEDFIIKTFCSGCKKLLLKYQGLMPGKMFVNDKVPVDVLHNEILFTDFVIIIGNTVSNQTPSKIYEIIGSGKPIIYLYQNDNDTALNTVRTYELSYVLKYSKLLDECEFKKLFDWCIVNKGKQVQYDDCIRHFPEHSVNNYIKTIYDVLKID